MYNDHGDQFPYEYNTSNVTNDSSVSSNSRSANSPVSPTCIKINNGLPPPVHPNSKWTCSFCSYTVEMKMYRTQHNMISKHCNVMFNRFQDPKTDHKSFKKILEAAIGQCYTYNVAKPTRYYTCRMCSSLHSSSKIKCIKHVVTYHFGIVGEKLGELQRETGSVQTSTKNVVYTGANNSFQQTSMTLSTSTSNTCKPTPAPTLPVEASMNNSQQSKSHNNVSYVFKWKCSICGAIHPLQYNNMYCASNRWNI